MKSILKNFAAATCFAALLALATAASAQPAPGASLLSPGTIWTGGIATGVTTNTYLSAAKMYCPGKECAISLQVQSDAANTGVLTVILGRNISGLTGSTNMEQFLTFQVLCTGATATTVGTNITVGAFPYLYLYSIANTNAANITNAFVRYNVK